MTTAELVVVKLGGETFAARQDALHGVVEAAARHRLVLVHGGGKRLSAWLERLGIETRFEGGLRVTDGAALEGAVAVLGGVINTELVAALSSLGLPAVGLTGADGGLIVAERLPHLGHVGRVVEALPRVIEALVDGGLVPVVAPLGIDETGAICNVNADDVAAGLAAALSARLVLLTDTDGVRSADGRTVDRLDEPLAEAMIEGGTISGGMIPKVRGALAALRAGSREVIIAEGRDAASLVRALEDPSFGTRFAPRTR
ncbi:MAG: acetylglutamate kinase [Chloroflexi bacterium]|nr:acetylglutamate kinase [Chloroflexota bacterium]